MFIFGSHSLYITDGRLDVKHLQYLTYPVLNFSHFICTFISVWFGLKPYIFLKTTFAFVHFPAMSEQLRGSFNGSSPPELRLVLLGNIGCGKTSSADTILGQLSPVTPSSSRSCQLRQGVSDGRSVTLVEAPRWFWVGGKVEDSVRKETEHALTLLAPGPHAVLLLVPVCVFTEVGCSPCLCFDFCMVSFARAIIKEIFLVV